MKEFEWFEWFEWFGPSPIEPFNSAWDHRVEGHLLFGVTRHAERQNAGQRSLPTVRKQGIEITQGRRWLFLLRKRTDWVGRARASSDEARREKLFDTRFGEEVRGFLTHVEMQERVPHLRLRRLRRVQ